ncbi:hypothetical protein Dvina_45805 [Dactylosporangium vinaceum]|uniref:Fimbrial assembly family protein n=1 Tax=Dactylosporangium vinaceum TaxID=53362 RepID=A0ABV5LYU5_9ACTN|nr:hypothetical protein [Dactylosporangium vinaceum]UAB95277.1 hypothetical protein Dvina_45805 [Dactylosporangium vinaceum]
MTNGDWKEPEGRLTGIVLPSFDEPDRADDLDEFERDRRARAARAAVEASDITATVAPPVSMAPPVPMVPAGPPPAWPPPTPVVAEESPEPMLATPPRREFPRFIRGEFVLPTDEAAAPVSGFDPLTAPVDVLETHLHPAPAAPPEGLRNALPSWALPAERTPTVDLPPEPLPEPAPVAVEPVTAPPAAEPTWEPVEVEEAPPPPVDEPTESVPVVPEPVAAEPVAAPPRKGPWEGVPHPAFPDATARTFRILPIAADLLPLEISENRHVRRVRRLVISGVVIVAALVVGWYGTAVRDHTQAGDDRQAILDTSQDLTRQRHKQYDELTKIQSDSGQIDQRLRKVLAYDLSWSKLLASLRSTAAAKNVTLGGVTAALSQEAMNGKPDGDIVGNVTLTGKAPTKTAVAAYVDALSTVPGVTNAFPSDATQETDGVSFTIRVDIKAAALGGRFTSAAPSASPSGSK